MLESGEDALYVARRLVRMASEDIGLAEPGALAVTIAAMNAMDFLGAPEGHLALAQAAVYLALAPKSNALYIGYGDGAGGIAKDALRAGAVTPAQCCHRLDEARGIWARLRVCARYEEKVTAMSCLPDSLAGTRVLQSYGSRLRAETSPAHGGDQATEERGCETREAMTRTGTGHSARTTLEGRSHDHADKCVCVTEFWFGRRAAAGFWLAALVACGCLGYSFAGLPTVIAQSVPRLTIDGECTAFAWAPDGRIVYSTRHVFAKGKFDIQRDDLWLLGVDGSRQKIFDGQKYGHGSGEFSYTVTSLRWSPDGTRLTAELRTSQLLGSKGGAAGRRGAPAARPAGQTDQAPEPHLGG